MKAYKPVYGSRSHRGNYKAGYCGFSYRDNSLVSIGISLFTREEEETIVPSHAFIIVDEYILIEATGRGVRFEDPNRYFKDPHCLVFFKKPVGLDSYKTQLILDEALNHLGEPYDYALFISFLFKLERSRWLRKLPALFNRKNAQVCSELVAGGLNKVPEYQKLEPLKSYHPSKLTPADLFRSKELFEEWDFD